MGALGLLTYRALLRKLDLSCLTAGPLISPVKGRRLCRSGFYRRFPFTEVFTFYDHFNKFWPGTNSALSGVDVMIISGLSFEASTHTHTHTQYNLSCVWPPLFPPSLQPMLSDAVPRFRCQRRGRRVLDEFTDDGSLTPGQSVFTAQSLNRTGLSISPVRI